MRICCVCAKVLENETKVNCLYICSNCFDSEIYFDFYILIKKIDKNLEKSSVLEIDEIKKNIFLYNNVMWIKKEYWNKNSAKIKRKICELRRKDELIKKINEMKLNSNTNTFNTYVKFGKPNVNEAVNILANLQINRNNRLYTLVNELDKHNIEYDKRIPIFQKYIKYGDSDIELCEVIDICKLEILLARNTNYIKYLEIYDEDTACNMALSEYIENGGTNVIANKYIKRKGSIKFE